MALIGDVAFFNLSEQRAAAFLCSVDAAVKVPPLDDKNLYAVTHSGFYCSGYAVAHSHSKQAYALGSLTNPGELQNDRITTSGTRR